MIHIPDRALPYSSRMDLDLFATGERVRSLSQKRHFEKSVDRMYESAKAVAAMEVYQDRADKAFFIRD